MMATPQQYNTAPPRTFETPQQFETPTLPTKQSPPPPGPPAQTYMT
jgi:hypothetical protein